MSNQQPTPKAHRWVAGTVSSLVVLAAVTAVVLMLVSPSTFRRSADTETSSTAQVHRPTPVPSSTRPAPIDAPQLVACTPPARTSSQPSASGAGAATGVPPVRIVNVGFEDLDNPAPGHLQKLNERLNQVDANAVSIAIGRMDWLGFPWAGHEKDESSAVQDTGQDLVARAIAALGCDSQGHKRRIVLGIDCLFGRGLSPAMGGVTIKGKKSTQLPSITGWTEAGGIGDRLAAMVHEVALRYHPYAVNITELFLDRNTFGADDLADFRKVTGVRSWPRNADGTIDTTSPALAQWRTGAMDQVIAKLDVAVAGTGVKLTMDVRQPASAALLSRPDIGQDYPKLLARVQQLNIWDFPGTKSSNALSADQLGRLLFVSAPSRYSLEIGLWKGNGIISMATFERQLRGAAQSGIQSVSVTPASLMTNATWQALQKAWAP